MLVTADLTARTPSDHLKTIPRNWKERRLSILCAEQSRCSATDHAVCLGGRRLLPFAFGGQAGRRALSTAAAVQTAAAVRRTWCLREADGRLGAHRYRYNEDHTRSRSRAVSVALCGGPATRSSSDDTGINREVPTSRQLHDRRPSGDAGADRSREADFKLLVAPIGTNIAFGSRSHESEVLDAG
jgi:hypothetical protein